MKQSIYLQKCTFHCCLAFRLLVAAANVPTTMFVFFLIFLSSQLLFLIPGPGPGPGPISGPGPGPEMTIIAIPRMIHSLTAGNPRKVHLQFGGAGPR